MLQSIHAGDTLSAVMQSDCIFDIHRLLLETGYMYIYRFGETIAPPYYIRRRQGHGII